MSASASASLSTASPCPIQLASQISGLSPHVIRIWERRYGALSPSRTDSNRRMYCEEAIERLKLLRVLTEGGHRIGNVARLDTEALRRLAGVVRGTAADGHAQGHGPGDLRLPMVMPMEAPEAISGVPGVLAVDLKPRMPMRMREPEDFVRSCYQATAMHDTDGLRCQLLRARQEFGQRGLLHLVVYPLILEVVDAWHHGRLLPSHDYLASSVLRELLMTPVPCSQALPGAPELIVCTPEDEANDVAALLVAAAGRDLGWRITYLGLCVPPEEISACVRARRARAVAMTIVTSQECPEVEEGLRQTREMLPAEVTMIVGGRAAMSYALRLDDVAIHWADNLRTLECLLTEAAEG